MNVSKFTEEHYAEVCNWWKAHSWPLMPLSLLPKTGYIVRDVAAGFLYNTDSGIAWIEWIVSNPESDKAIRNEALDLILGNLIDDAKKMNKTFIFTSSDNEKLINRYKKHGFSLGDTGVTHLGRGI